MAARTTGKGGKKRTSQPPPPKRFWVPADLVPLRGYAKLITDSIRAQVQRRPTAIAEGRARRSRWLAKFARNRDRRKAKRGQSGVKE